MVLLMLCDFTVVDLGSLPTALRTLPMINGIVVLLSLGKVFNSTNQFRRSVIQSHIALADCVRCLIGCCCDMLTSNIWTSAFDRIGRWLFIFAKLKLHMLV